jgi:phosphohistidine phosphatase SixA
MTWRRRVLRYVTVVAVGAGLPESLAAQQDRLVLLVRHAERAQEPADDPGLTPAGVDRAQALREVLAATGLNAVITTQLRRTQLTAAPSAEQYHLTPIVVRAGGGTEAHGRAVAEAVRARPAGEAVLVVGHSNTVPAIIAALGGPALPDLCDSEYATLFTLLVPAVGSPRLVRSTYGAPDPPAAQDCRRTMR